MTEPIQTPYNKVNVVDAEGNLVTSFGGGSNQDLASATNQQTEINNLQQINSKLEEIKDYGSPVTGAILPAGGNKLIGWLSAIWQTLIQRLPPPINGRVPVDVASLSVNINNTQLEISNDAGNPIPISLPSSVVIPSFLSVAASGTILSGNISVSFLNFGSSAGLLLGTALPPGATVNFAAPVGQRIGAINYDATGTTYLISTLQ